MNPAETRRSRKRTDAGVIRRRQLSFTLQNALSPAESCQSRPKMRRFSQNTELGGATVTKMLLVQKIGYYSPKSAYFLMIIARSLAFLAKSRRKGIWGLKDPDCYPSTIPFERPDQIHN